MMMFINRVPINIARMHWKKEENGDDEYIHDARQDIFERFENFKKVL